MAARPNSLAGTSTVAAAVRIAADNCRRSSKGQSSRHSGGLETIAGVKRSGLAVEPNQGATHQNSHLLVEGAGEVEHRGASAQRLTPVLSGHFLGATEEGEVDMLERLRRDGLDEGDFIAHLVELAVGLV